MATEYDRSRMIDELEKYFKRRRYETSRYTDRRQLDEIRLPLYCIKGDRDTSEEIIVDVITEGSVSKEDFLPDRTIGTTTVLNACSVKFFQYYLPHAKVFWAFGHYVKRDKSYKRFKKACEDNGIGLLIVYDAKVRQILPPSSLSSIWQNDVEIAVSKWAQSQPWKDQLVEWAQSQPWKDQLVEGMSDLNERYLEEYRHRIIMYGDPQFRCREIISREAEDVSPSLINRLQGLSNIAYAQELKELAKGFRTKPKSDYYIALELLQVLWTSRFQIDYPDLLKDFEKVLHLASTYRDHFLHQLQVFFVGALIIDTLYSESWVQDFGEENHVSKFEDAWLAASTYHDFNYPIQEWENWTKDFLKKTFHTNDLTIRRHLEHPDIQNQIVELHLGKVVVRDDFLSKLSRLSDSIGSKFNDCFQRFILHRVAIDKNHAALGAFTFLEIFHRNTMLNESAANAAAGSILLHDKANWQCFCGNKEALQACNTDNSCTNEEEELCQDPFLMELSLQANPLTFLLIFCDTAQEWGRRRGEDAIDETPLLESIDLSSQKVMVHISLKNQEAYTRKREEIEEVGRYLKDPRFGIKISRKIKEGELTGGTMISMLGREEQ